VPTNFMRDYKVIVNKKNRQYINVPTHDVQTLIGDLVVENNNLFYKISIVPQGIGYFYVAIEFNES